MWVDAEAAREAIGGISRPDGEASVAKVARLSPVNDYIDPLPDDIAAARGRSMSEFLADIVTDVTVDGRVLTWNEGCEAMVGLPAEKAIGRHLDELLAGMLSGAAMTWLKLRTRAGAAWSEEHVSLGPGSHIILKVAVLPLHGDNGELLGYTILARDPQKAGEEMVDVATRALQYATVVESVHVGIGMRDESGKLTYVNERLAQMLGYRSGEMVGMQLRDLWMPEDRDARVKMGLPMEEPDQREFRYRRKDGSALSVLKESTPLYDAHNQFVGSIFTMSDISKLVEARTQAMDSDERFRRFFEFAQVGVVLTTLEGDMAEINPAFAQMLGYAPEELFGKSTDDLLCADNVYPARSLRTELTQNGLAMSDVEHCYQHRNGETVWLRTTTSAVPDGSGKPSYLIVVFSDISARVAAQEELADQARHDALTGLPNRSVLLEKIGDSNDGCCEGDNGSTALLFLDLDQFKLVNDALGHLAGDELLKGVARRLEAAAREGEMVARLGGDEFVVLAQGLRRPSDAESVAARLLDHLRAPFYVVGRQLFVTASIGIASCVGNAEASLREADEAMYRAKEMGRNQFASFEPALHYRTSRHLRLASQLHDALQKDQLSLRFQPIVDLQTGGVAAFETLLRWQHPKDGFLEPGEFIPLAEELGLIPMIGEWVTRQACLHAAGWQDVAPGVGVHINVSPHELGDAFVGRLIKSLGAANLAPEHVVVEITEMAMMPSRVSDGDVLGTLSDLGVTLSIDDFGTGYSSLSYLQKLPVDELKIDRKFVDRICESEADRAVVISVIQLAHALGLRAVAEGVETAAQAEVLASLGCDRGQGFYWSRPVPVEAIAGVVSGIGVSAFA